MEKFYTMKKIVLTIVALCCFLSETVFGQAFTTQYDTVSASTNAIAIFGSHNTVLTTQTTNLLYIWKVSGQNLPADWINDGFSLCDGSNCYDTLALTQSHTDTVRANKPAEIQLHVRPGTSNVTYYLTLKLRDVGNTTTKYITFLFNKWPTGVANISKTDESVTVYPNPARENVNVIFDENLNAKSVAVYNLIGKVVCYYRTAGNSAAIDLSDVPSGIYFLRLMNAQGEVVATRKFTHQ